MEQSKNLVLDLSWKWTFCSKSQELADNLEKLYKTDASIKKSVDAFLNEFNKDKEEIISLNDIFDVYNWRKIAISKVILVKKFFREYFNNYNVWISINGEEYIWTDWDINLVKKTVLQIITWEKKYRDEIHMFVIAVKSFLIEINCKIDEILCNNAKEILKKGELESSKYFEKIYETIKLLDNTKLTCVLMALYQQWRIIKPAMDRRGYSIGQNILELFETIPTEEISKEDKELLEKNLNEVISNNWEISEENIVLITKLLIINQDKIDIKNFLKFKDKKIKNKELDEKPKKRKKWLLEQLLPKLEDRLGKKSENQIFLGNNNINIEEFLLFVQNEIEKKIKKREISEKNYFFEWKQISQDFTAKVTFKLKLSKKKKNILSMISEEELNNYLLMFISGYNS